MSKKVIRKVQEKKDPFLEAMNIVKEVGILIFLGLMFYLFPFYSKNYYNQIGEAKFQFFKLFGIICFSFLLIISIITVIYRLSKMKEGSIKDWFKNVSITDYFVAGYGVFATISYVFSDYKDLAFWGYDGWRMGLFAQIMFVLIYFYVSRFYKTKSEFVFGIFVAAFFVFLFGVLHRFQIDPLGYYTNMNLDFGTRIRFLSTLGNSNWYSSFLSILLPFGVFYYWYTNNKIVRSMLIAYLAMGYASVVTQNSDSSFSAAFFVLVVLFYASFTSNEKMQRFLEVVLIMLVSFKGIGILQNIFPEQTAGLDTLSYAMSKGMFTWFLLAAFAIIYILYRVFVKEEKFNIANYKWLKFIFMGIIAAGILALITVIVLNSNGMLANQMTGYLLFNDQWGTGRGFNWRVCIETFFKMNLKSQLIGVGPDSFSRISSIFFAKELQEQWNGSVLTNAHNEWLNIFVNYGVLGSIAYMGIFFTSFKRSMQQIGKEPYLLMTCLCIIGYVTHNLFCYQQVICTPFVFIFMGIGESIYRNRKTEEARK